MQRIYRHMPNSYQWLERLALGTLVPVLCQSNNRARSLQRPQPLPSLENKLISPS